MPDVYAPSMPSIREALYTMDWRVVGAALGSPIIHDIVEAMFTEDLLIPPRPSHPQ
jgi:hypothetical protein